MSALLINKHSVYNIAEECAIAITVRRALPWPPNNHFYKKEVRKIVVGRETRLGKRNQGDDRPGKQNNIAMATETFSEVQQL